MPQWTGQSQFGQDNGLARNTALAPPCKIKWAHRFLQGPGIFTIPTALKLYFHPWEHVWLNGYADGFTRSEPDWAWVNFPMSQVAGDVVKGIRLKFPQCSRERTVLQCSR